MSSMSIVQYPEYRDFLAACLEKWKSRGPKFSFQAAARKLGTSRAYLKLLVDKRRHMSLEKAVALADFFGWTAFEKQYFLFLYLRGTTTNPTLAGFFDSILGSLRYYERTGIPVDDLQGGDRASAVIFRDWLRMVISEVCELKGFQNDPAWIQTLLGGPEIVALKHVEDTLRVLKEAGIIVEKDGQLKRTKSPYTDHISPYDHEEYQRFKTGLARAAQAIDRKGKDDLHRPNRYQMYALALDAEAEKRLLKLYDDLDEELRKLSLGVPNSDRILFVSNNLFGVSRVLKG